MKKFILNILICLCLVAPLSVFALEEDTLTERSISVPSENISMTVGETRILEYKVEDEGDPTYTITFASADELILTVDANGYMKAIKKGKTFVTIVVIYDDPSMESLTKKVNVEVVEIPAKLSFDKSDLSVVRNSTYKVEYKLEAGTTGSDIIWESSDPLIASVVNGVVRAHKVGTVTIKGSVADVEATMLIRVIVPLERLEFNPKEVKIKVSQEIKMPGLIFIPYDTTASKKVSYTIDDDSIVALEKGKLTGLKEGTTSIIARINGKSVILNVIVEMDEEVTNNFIVNFNVERKNEEAIVLRSGSMADYKVGKVDINLPVAEIISYMQSREVTRVKLVFDDMLSKNYFDLVNSMVIPKDIFLLLGAQKLEISIVDMENTVWASYFFNTRTKNDIDLKVETKLIDSRSNLIVQTGNQKAYTLEFNNSLFPSGTFVSLNTALFNRIESDYYFLYRNHNGSLIYTDQQAHPQDNFVRFLIEESNYVVSFNRFVSGQDNRMLYGLMALVAVLLGAIGYRGFKRVRNRD